MSVTLGTDPEFFLVDGRTGDPIPACGLLGGTKGAPIDIGEGFGLQEDNVMVEWNMPPCSIPEQFADRAVEGLERVMNFVRTKVPNAARHIGNSLVFPVSMMQSEQAQEFGCSPDFDAYQRGAPAPLVEPATFSTRKGEQRFAGGHIHIGFDNPNEVPEFVTASLCDLFIGLRSIYHGDRQGERRNYYGQPGRFRPTDYGIEYRTVSNYWLGSWDDAYSLAIAAKRVGRLIEGDVELVQTIFRETAWNDVRRAIINEDRTLAGNLLRYVNNEYGGA